MIPRVLLLLCLCSSLAPLAAQEHFEGKPLRRVAFLPEEQPLPRADLLRNLDLHFDEPFNAREVSVAMKRLYLTGRFEDIVVEAEADGDGVALIFKTTPSWFVGRVAVAGVPEPPNPGQLANATQLNLGTPFISRNVDQAVANLKETLKSNGLYRAKIFPEFQADPSYEQIHIRFDVTPGERAKFAAPVISGDLLRSESKLIRTTRWRGWLGFGGYTDFTSSRAQRGIERLRQLYREKEHLTSRISLEKLDYDPATNRVTPVVSLEKGPVVEIRPDGVKFSQRKLKQLVPVYQELAVDRTLLVEGARNIEQYLQIQGYFNASAEFEIGDVENNVQSILYTIDRGERSKLVDLAFEGNKYFDDDTLRERLYTRTASFLQFRHGRVSEDLLKKDREAIASLYRSNGFRDVEVSHKIDDAFGGKQNQRGVRIIVKEGPQWFVSAMELEGVNLQFYEYIRSLMQSNPGQPYSDVSVAADRDAILNYYYNTGYPEASLEFSVKPGPAANRVAIRFTVNEGPRLFVRTIVLSGLEATHRKLIDTRISLKPGDPLSLTALTESQRELYDLGIFARVDAVIQNPDGKERNKHLLFDMEEAKRYAFDFGFGAALGQIGGGGSSGFQNPSGTTGFSPRVSLGISRTNLFGIGHTASVSTRFSNIQERAVISYLAPQFQGNPNWNLNISGVFDQARDVNTYTAQRLEGSVQLAQRFSKATTLQYRLAFRRVAVRDIRIDPALIPLYSQPVRVGTAGLSHIFDRRDDPAATSRGLFNTIDISLATKVLASQATFARVAWKNATYHRVARQTVLARSLTFGWISGMGKTSTPEDIPLPERLFGGGANSHRGFPENQAGPRDLVTGFPLGGSATLFNSVELRFPLLGENLGGVLFHDMGNIYRSVSDISFAYSQPVAKTPFCGYGTCGPDYRFNYMVQALGFGIRYRTPIGPVRLDLSFTPNSPRFRGLEGTYDEIIAGKGRTAEQRISRFQFHFSIGQTF